MSKKFDIEGKKVDFYVYDNHAAVINSVVEEEDHGKLNIVVDEINPSNNAIYVGNEHIASGYGFDNVQTVEEVEEFLSSDVVQKIINNDFNVVNQITYEVTYTGEGSTALVDSSIIYHNEEIRFENGKLGGKTSIVLYDTSFIKLSNGEIINAGKTHPTTLDANELSIESIKLDYDILDTENPEKELQYKFKIEINGEEEEKSYHSFTVTADGIKKSVILPLDAEDKVIIKKDDALENVVNYYIIVKDNDDLFEKKYKLFTIVYRYKIYGSTTTDTPASAVIYNKSNENIIKINSSTDTFSYIWVPSKVTAEGSLPVVLKKSDIAGEFIYVDDKQLGDIDYRIYKSPQMYRTNTSWVVKL